MGVFSVTVQLGDPDGRNFRPVDMIVDTGASHTSLPASMLRDIGVTPHSRQRFVMADGRTADSDIGRTWIRIDGRDEVTIVVFSEEGTQPLLGAVTLEEFQLGIDTVGRKLVPVVGYRLAKVKGDD